MAQDQRHATHIMGIMETSRQPLLARCLRVDSCRQNTRSLDIPQEFLVRDRNKVVSPWLSSEEFVAYTRDYWEFETSTPSKAHGHPASFPVELPRRLIKLFAYSGATVLDPFAGSGTVGLAAKELGCSAVLVDIDQSYCNLMRDRISQGGLFDA